MLCRRKESIDISIAHPRTEQGVEFILCKLYRIFYFGRIIRVCVCACRNHMRSLIPSIFRSTSREHICAQVCRTPIMRPQIRRCSVAVGDEIRVVVGHLEVIDGYPGDALLVEILDDFQHPPVGTDDDLADEQLAGFGPPTGVDWLST